MITTETKEYISEKLEEWKEEAGQIPDLTCSDINKLIDELSKYAKEIDYYKRNAKYYETPEELMDDIPDFYVGDIIDTLENLRGSNEKLRELSKLWYKNCMELIKIVEANND
jgi:hypothetical protein